jgi:hypothetical protein
MPRDETELKAMVKKAAQVIKDCRTLKVPISQFIFQCIDKAPCTDKMPTETTPNRHRYEPE